MAVTQSVKRYCIQQVTVSEAACLRYPDGSECVSWL